jgi:hypothetical protein
VSTVETGNATTTANFNITAGTAALSVRRWRSEWLQVTLESVAGATAGSYEGSVALVSRATGTRLHIPVWLRVIQAPSVDVLLVDDDGSAADPAFADYSTQYKNMLDSLGLTYEYIEPWNEGFFSVLGLFKFRSMIVFTGDNDSFNTSGFFLSDQEAIAEWLDSGGRLWAVGQNFAETSDSNGTSPRLGRARLYNGYLGLAQEAASAGAPPHTATGAGPFGGMTLGLNQGSVEVSSPIPDTDTYASQHTTGRFFAIPGNRAVSHGRTSDPTLEEERQEYRYRAASMGFGIEGLTGPTTATQLGDKTMDWLLDRLTVGLESVSVGRGKRATLTANAVSSHGSITKYRWDFDDRSRWVTTTGPTVTHKFRRSGTFDVRIEATDSLGHTSVGHALVRVRGGGDDDDD